LVASDYFGWQWGARQSVASLTSRQEEYDELILDADFTQPSILLRFFGEGCGKCRAGNGDDFNPYLRQVFALRPYNIRPAFQPNLLQTLHYPSGAVGFHIAEINGGTFGDAGLGARLESPAERDASFDGRLKVIGLATIPAQHRVVIGWEVMGKISEDYSVSARLVSADGDIVAQDDFLLGDWQDRTPQWLPASIRYSVHHLPRISNVEQSYSLFVSLYVLGPPLRNVPVLTESRVEETLYLGETRALSAKSQP
jgi:hypothetical protein